MGNHCAKPSLSRVGGKWQLSNAADLSQGAVEALLPEGCLANKNPSGALAEVMNTLMLRLTAS